MSAEAVLSGERVGELLAELLDLREPVAPGADLLALEGFSSLTIMMLVTELEAEVGHELDAALMVPETFESPATIAAALSAS